MKISGLKVDGYGVWSGLKLERLTDGLNVLYGPNEAGKTTLLQFIRSVLYGFSPTRQKYFPPVRGGRPGGSIELFGPSGRFHVQRHQDADGQQEQVTLTAADGTRQGEHLIKVLRCDVDEATYNNVFAVGLREMQELGTLSDTEAAELLYRLTAGLDRVSLVEVIRELETSRSRILDREGGPCQVVQLLEQRQRLRAEIEELGKLARRYGRLAAERSQLERELTRLEEENHRTEDQARVIELAISLRNRWKRRVALDEELVALGSAAAMPPGAVDRLDALSARLQKHRQRAEQLRDRREQLHAEAAGLAVKETLWRQAARIEALREQESWITTLQNQIAELEVEIAELESGLAAEQERFGLGDRAEGGLWPDLSPQKLSGLRPLVRVLRQCQQRVSETRQQVATSGAAVESLTRQIETALSARAESDLAEAMDRAGNLAAGLRRRLQIDGRLAEMAQYQREMEQQSRKLFGRQLLPVWVLLGLGGVFVFGVVLVMVGLLMPTSITGSVGWWLVLFGLGGGGLAGAGKVVLERSNARRLEACQKQISVLQAQIHAAEEEREALAEKLPRGVGSLAGRLEAAEKELAELEALMPLETRRAAAQQETQAAAARLNLAEQQRADAVRRWRGALAAAGLPEKLSPKQVRQLVRQCDQFSQQHRRLTHRREDLQRRRRELESLSGRIAQLAADTGVELAEGDPVEQLQQLALALDEQETRTARRDLLRRQARQLKRKRLKHQRAVRRLKDRRRELLREAGADDEQEFRQRALQAARAEVLRQERDAIAREITTAIGGSCGEETVGQQLEGDGNGRLELRRDELLERLGALEEELRQRIERRGQLNEQLKSLGEDRQIAAKQLELATVEKRLEEAVRRWQVLAVTSRTLDAIRATYEEERQPETLREASGYLDRLTRGRYRRVWTPLGEDVLRIDDAKGNSLSVEVLSRGTREQLFLALRLALVACYARRGASLPLVLDDVLVNFDADRAKAAAGVLRDFAAAGHQLLVFTCHEHILKLFKALRVPVRRLPDHAEAEPVPVTFEQPANAKRKRTKRAVPPPVEVEADIEDEDDYQWEEADEKEVEEYEDEFEDDDTAEAA